ncbi:FkbM family methyltransferase [Desulfobulbus sp. TB]|nr:FkbM family methyltransferase [Desulfobulbus sp. TB]
MNTARKFAKKVPGIRPAVRMARKIAYWLRYQSILPRLYPVNTDSPLIRFGPHGDGGYLIPDDLVGISACFSPGVSTISGFEKDCADCGIKVYLADASVDVPAESHHLFEFSKTFIGGYSKKNFVTLEQWIAQSSVDTDKDFMMQMDIEGFEYEALSPVSVELMKRFRIIVIEFHGLDCLDKGKTRIFRKLQKTHTCVHIHPNNCCGFAKLFNLEIPRVMEFTFLRKDRVGRFSYRHDFPHLLDFDNISKPTLPLPACWYCQK